MMLNLSFTYDNKQIKVFNEEFIDILISMGYFESPSCKIVNLGSQNIDNSTPFKFIYEKIVGCFDDVVLEEYVINNIFIEIFKQQIGNSTIDKLNELIIDIFTEVKLLREIFEKQFGNDEIFEREKNKRIQSAPFHNYLRIVIDEKKEYRNVEK